MRWALALSLVLLALAARAEPVDFTLTDLTGTTTWSLEVDVAPGFSARTILLEASQSLGVFTPASELTECCQVLVQLPLPNGRNLVFLTALQAQSLVPAGDRTLVGTFAATTASAVEIDLVGAEGSAGATVLDVAGTSVDYSIRIVPEPALAALALIGVATAVGVRLTRP